MTDPTGASETPESVDIPKIFWEYYDLFRRKKMTINEFSNKTGLSVAELRRFLSVI